MRRPDRSDGMGMCILMNLMLHPLLPVIAIILAVLCFMHILPWIFPVIILVLWLIEAVVLSYMIRWGNRCAKREDPPLENKNPYSGKNS